MSVLDGFAIGWPPVTPLVEQHDGPSPCDEQRVVTPPPEHDPVHDRVRDAANQLHASELAQLRCRVRDAEAATFEAVREAACLRESHANSLYATREAFRCCDDLRAARSAAEQAAASAKHELVILRSQRVRVGLRGPLIVGTAAGLLGLILGVNLARTPHVDLSWKDPVEVQRFNNRNSAMRLDPPLPLPGQWLPVAEPVPSSSQLSSVPPGRPMPVADADPAQAIEVRPAHSASARAR